MSRVGFHGRSESSEGSPPVYVSGHRVLCLGRPAGVRHQRKRFLAPLGMTGNASDTPVAPWTDRVAGNPVTESSHLSTMPGTPRASSRATRGSSPRPSALVHASHVRSACSSVMRSSPPPHPSVIPSEARDFVSRNPFRSAGTHQAAACTSPARGVAGFIPVRSVQRHRAPHEASARPCRPAPSSRLRG